MDAGPEPHCQGITRSDQRLSDTIDLEQRTPCNRKTSCPGSDTTGTGEDAMATTSVDAPVAIASPDRCERHPRNMLRCQGEYSGAISVSPSAHRSFSAGGSGSDSSQHDLACQRTVPKTCIEGHTKNRSEPLIREIPIENHRH